jgi:hypothetical protein
MLWIGLVIGFTSSLLLFLLTHRTNFRNLVKLPLIIQELKETKIELDQSKQAFQQMMRDVHHNHLKPHPANIEGYLRLMIHEKHLDYAEQALIEVEKMKEKISSFFKKYEKFQ